MCTAEWVVFASRVRAFVESVSALMPITAMEVQGRSVERMVSSTQVTVNFTVRPVWRASTLALTIQENAVPVSTCFLFQERGEMFFCYLLTQNLKGPFLLPVHSILVTIFHVLWPGFLLTPKRTFLRP